ncbi:Sororin [Galemys pyrenaicus]|uniref:Sororin n=1 Tax=Galemys pyrenaicus TaxID=202257 RepID=A0A8J6AJC1_GALPY|nr:Sororin [Galemys pyrenaicus]
MFLEPKGPSPQSLRKSQRKSDSGAVGILPDICPKVLQATPVRKPILLKKIVASALKISPVQSLRRSPRIACFSEKENHPPAKEPTRGNCLRTPNVPVTPTSSPVLWTCSVESSAKDAALDARDLEMSKKVRRSYSRLETPACSSASTSTPGRRSCFGFDGLLGAEELTGVSPVVCSKLTEAPRAPEKPWVPDTTLPGISPPAVKEKRKKKKVPEILKSELDEWAAAMNAEFEAAEQFELLVE